ncbi:MAG: phosphoenolpyruvate--protein phosphotransferase [Acidobacteriota bacterium]
MQVRQGLAAAGGIAVGRAVCMVTRAVEIYRFPIADGELDAEVERLREAVRRTEQEIRRTQSGVVEELGQELAEIFDAHVLMLADQAFVERIVGRIRSEHANAEWVVHRTTEELIERFNQLDDPRMRERAEDLRDVGRYLLRMLQGIAHHELAELDEDVIIVADDLTPSDAVRLGRQRVIGLAVESGGRTSHTTIIAHSLNIPLVTGLKGVVDTVTDEDPVIVDGESGEFILHPTPEALADYSSRRDALRSREADLLATCSLPARSLDGVEITLQANIDLPEEIDQAATFGAQGVGLYRSEFLYIEMSPRLPTEEDHMNIYRQLAEACAPLPAIIRTYDLGGRKLAREVMDTREENPVLGLRGIRLTLARPGVFRTQLRGLFRASVYGEIWVMLPLVSTLDEVRKFRAFAASVMSELEAEGKPFRRDLKIGVMIEVPSAAVIADLLAREVDFFSIGTNDLIQYSMAVDRNNEEVTDLYQPLHPALLRMLRFCTSSAREAGIPIGVCGEMAADARFVPLLLGLGIRRLSMSPRAVPHIKALIRGLRVDELQALALECVNLPTAAEVESRLRHYLDGVTA